jgi:hypothetical protein
VSFSKNAVAPFETWQSANLALKMSGVDSGEFAAFYGGRISPEHYQFAPVARMLQLPRPSLLIADDVGLGKTIEAGICLLELLARGRGKRILLVVPPGLIPQWQEEMVTKLGLKFEAIENAAGLERAQTRLSEGIKPWVFLNRVITSIEYLKKREVLASALEPRWDVIVVDEAHYLAESGTPRSPYLTARARLGPRLRDHSKALILLSATPHNGYSHSFRSLLEIIEPTDASFTGEKTVVARRVGRSMIRRLKGDITKSGADGGKMPAFKVREPVKAISVSALANAENRGHPVPGAGCRVRHATASTLSGDGPGCSPPVDRTPRSKCFISPACSPATPICGRRPIRCFPVQPSGRSRTRAVPCRRR